MFEITVNGTHVPSTVVGDFRDSSFKLVNIAGLVNKGENVIELRSTVAQRPETYEHLENSWAFESMKNTLSYDEEIEHLQEKYGEPRGRLFLVRCDGAVAGCIAIRYLEEGVCELKRVYLRPAYQGKGVGRKMMEKIIDEDNFRRSASCLYFVNKLVCCRGFTGTGWSRQSNASYASVLRDTANSGRQPLIEIFFASSHKGTRFPVRLTPSVYEHHVLTLPFKVKQTQKFSR
jgi:GNAT superfamily N-acetyltransferase